MRSSGLEGDRFHEVCDVSRLDQLAREEGARHGPLLLKQPPSGWRRTMRGDPCYRGYGTLEFLLEAARAKFETEPAVAREITAAVLDFVDGVEDAPSRVHWIGLQGLAWKEHANALRFAGDLRQALQAVERSIEIYGQNAGLHFEQTRARLASVNIHREIGNLGQALSIARECGSIFLDYGQRPFVTMARLCEGAVLFSLKQFAEALRIYTAVVEEAEIEGDKLTLARGLTNVAECARELGDLAAARDLYPRALVHFEELNLPTEAARVRWGYALSLAALGRIPSAVSELYKVRAVYLSLGANADATVSMLDIVRIRFDADEDVQELCADLVATCSAAGLTQNAIEALAYLREQSKRRMLTSTKINRVRTYIGELTRTPALLFARPDDDEGE